MNTVRTLLVLVAALGLLLVGCKSEDEKMALQLSEEVMKPLEAAKATGDPKKLDEHCLSMSIALENKAITDLVKQGGQTRDVVQKMRKMCEGMTSLEDQIARELEEETGGGEE